MPNQFVLQRLAGIQTILNGVHQAGSGMSSASKGTERETFVDSFLSQVLPAPFRFGTGDATDAAGAKSGQLDVVVEYPFGPSLPTPGTGDLRLYLAESVAAVVEVKSDVAGQINEAVSTANQLAPLVRSYPITMVMGQGPQTRIPLFVAGYTGWKTMSTVQQHLNANPNIDGILVIDSGLFVSNAHFGGVTASGPWALWGLICCLHQATSTLKSASTNPGEYAT